MWLLLAFCSAALLGFYDVFKKKSLNNNAVLPVLGLNTLFSSLIFLPFILISAYAPSVLNGSIFYVPEAGWEVHKFIILKSFIVLSSWIFRHEAPSAYYSRTDKCYSSGNDVGRGNAYIRRTP